MERTEKSISNHPHPFKGEIPIFAESAIRAMAFSFGSLLLSFSSLTFR